MLAGVGEVCVPEGGFAWGGCEGREGGQRREGPAWDMQEAGKDQAKARGER